MNVYLFELRRTWKSAASWAAVLLILLGVLMAVVYPVYSNARADVEAAMAGFPPQFAAAFIGVSIDQIFSYGGFYAFGFLYLSLLGAIMASILGLDLFAREKRAKCTDFLMTKPMSRSDLFSAKFLAGLTLLILTNVLYIIVSVILYRSVVQGASTGRVVLASSALFFTQLVIYAISVLTAVCAKKIRSTSGSSMAIGFGGFVLSALHSILHEDALRYITPYKYFDVTLAFSEGRFETPYVITAAAVTVTLLIIAFVKYCRTDIHAV